MDTKEGLLQAALKVLSKEAPYTWTFNHFKSSALLKRSDKNDKNLWIAHHGFLQPPYFKAWGDHINELYEEA